jgi:hypothetical protein
MYSSFGTHLVSDAIEVAMSSNALPLPLALPNQGVGAVNTATNG